MKDAPIAPGFSPGRMLRVLLGLVVLLVAAAAWATAVGPTRISLATAWADSASRDAEILFSIRLPWVLLAAAVGASLSTAGAAFQGLLRNPLADPFILGMSGGASLGVVLGLTVGASSVAASALVIPAWGFAGALGATLLVWRLSSVGGQTNNYTMLLAGVVVNAVFGAVIMFVISVARPDDVHRTALWLMGILDVFQISRPLLVVVALATLIGIVMISTLGTALNVLSLGEHTARHLGVPVVATRRKLFFLGALLVGAATAVAGPIGFVGLLVPHLIRMVLGPDHRLLLPASAIAGAAFLLVAGSLARVAFPLTHSQVPVGVVTACLGGPFFLWLLRRKGQLYG